VDYALDFDGVDDYVNINNINTTFTEFSLSYWIKRDDNGVISEDFISWNGDGGSENDGTFYTRIVPGSDGHVFFRLRAANFGDGQFFGYSNISNNTWYYITVTMRNSLEVAKIYINGEEIAERSGTGNIIIDSNFDMGGYGSDSRDYMKGAIDEVSMWEKALTVEEIQSYMSISPTGDENGLVGYWDFSEGEDNILYDHSSNGNDGTIFGANWIERESNGPSEFCDATVPDGWADNSDDVDDNCLSNAYDCAGECTDTGSAVIGI
jgi:hypothetical protein